MSTRRTLLALAVALLAGTVAPLTAAGRPPPTPDRCSSPCARWPESSNTLTAISPAAALAGDTVLLRGVLASGTAAVGSTPGTRTRP